MNKPVLVEAKSVVNNIGSFEAINKKLDLLSSNKIQVAELYMDPLKTPWHSEIKQGHFRSGAAPVYALKEAYSLIETGKENAVLITGKDYLKSDYSGEERKNLMEIYEGYTIPQAYTKLAYKFIEENGLSENGFKNFAIKLFENYQKTAAKRGLAFKPDKKWHSFITKLFRGVDIANPVVDFHAKALVISKKIYNKHFANQGKIILSGVATEKLSVDGPEYVDEIVNYNHLKKAYDDACTNAGIDFKKEFINENAYLEIYTCFPVVPLAFLIKTGIAQTTMDIFNVLKNYEITVTGGMNLAKAPFNNPVLNALVIMFEKLKTGKRKYGLLHGNGGLGYNQGIAILEHKP